MTTSTNTYPRQLLEHNRALTVQQRQHVQSKSATMLKLDYTAGRSDGTTISQLRGLILSEQATIDNLESRIANCRESQADYICRLSQEERDQLVLDQPKLFPNGLPDVDKIPYVGPALPNASRKPLEDR